MVSETPAADDVLNAKIAEKPFPKVTADAMAARIASTFFFQPESTTLTICVVKLDNGYTVTGESGCADPRNFDPDLGKQLAYKNAFNKLWPLFGFALAEDLKAGRVQ